MKDRLRKVQFKYLDYLFENICGVKSKFYPDSTFFKKDDKVILELEKSGTLWVLYSVWNSISDTFSIQYEETQQLIKEWMEAQLKQGVVAPDAEEAAYFQKMEAQLKQGEVAPVINYSTTSQLMEAQLKLGEVTPIPSWLVMKQKVESQLKNEVVVPKKLTLYASQYMGKQLKNEEVTPQRMNYVIIGGAGEELEEVTQ